MELFITLTIRGWANQRADICCLSSASRPGVRGLFRASCIEGSSLDTRWILGAIVRRLSRGKYIILCESGGQRVLACFS